MIQTTMAKWMQASEKNVAELKAAGVDGAFVISLVDKKKKKDMCRELTLTVRHIPLYAAITDSTAIITEHGINAYSPDIILSKPIISLLLTSTMLEQNN
ncbi:MAG: hypothetical protein IPG99_07535 [Ignavibacteria bacterium]|nr:hypothetical protein [Ignavibacteria bacterium]